MVTYTFQCPTEECKAHDYVIEEWYSSISQYESKGQPDCPLCGIELERAFFDAPSVGTGWVGSAGDEARPATCGAIKREKPKTVTLAELLKEIE